MRKILCIIFSLLLWDAFLVHGHSNERKKISGLSGTVSEIGRAPKKLPTLLQGVVITGTVTDSQGAPLPGVSISVEGVAGGAITNVDGKYTITVPNEQAVIKFTFVGYLDERVTVGSQRVIDMKLVENMKQLDEVVVTALNIPKETKAISTARQSVDAVQMTESREPNLVTALDGKAAGLMISTSGSPTGSSRIVMRGESSISGNSQPLFVVDGMPIDNSQSSYNNVDLGNNAMDLNPSDIASIEVLPGANAAALYGTRAANGAIIITTKKAAMGNKYIGVSLNANYLWSKINEYPVYQNVYGQGNAGIATQNGTGSYVYNPVTGAAIRLGNDLRSWGSPMLGQPMITPSGEYTTYSPNPGNVEDFFKAGLTSTYNIALEKGEENSSLRASYTFRKANDIMPNANLRNTHTFSLAASRKLKFITFETSLNYLNDDVNNAIPMNRDNSSPFKFFANMLRNLKIDDLTPWKDPATGYEYQPGVNAVGFDNPFWQLYENSNEKKRSRLYGTIKTTIKISDDLSFRGTVAPDLAFNEINFYKQMFSITDKDGQVNEIVDNSYTWNYEGILMYNKKIKDVSINALAGSQRYDYNETNRNANVDVLIIPNNKTLQNSATNPTVTDNYSEKKSMGVFGSLSLGYKSLAFLDITGRNDWSSTLPENKNSFFYPSVSGSFVFSDAFKWTRFLPLGKIRASWARAGNDAPIYSLKTQFLLGGLFNGTPYLNLDNTMKNSALQPEQTESVELGTDLKFWQGRISFSGTLYKKKTTHQIFTASIPTESGYSKYIVNAGEIDNKGIEINANVIPIQLKNLTVTAFGNFSKNINEVVSLLPGVTRFQLYSSGVNVNAEVGQPFGIIRGRAIGTDAYGHRMVNSSGQYVTNLDQVCGFTRPDWIGSAGINLKFMNFDFSCLFTARIGGKLFSYTQYEASVQGATNATMAGRNEWTLSSYILGENNQFRKGINDNSIGGLQPYKDNTYQNLAIDKNAYFALTDQNGQYIYDANGYYIAAGKNTYGIAPYNWFMQTGPVAEMFMYNASYIKLKQLSIGYTFPRNLFKGFVKSARISLNGNNLVTLMKHTPLGIDPESAANQGNSVGIDNGGAFPYGNYGFDLRISF